MKKLLGSLLVLLSVGVASCLAQDTVTGYVQALGHVRQPNGVLKDVTGTWVPFVARRIPAKAMTPYSWTSIFEPKPQIPPRAQPFTSTTVYLADAGSGYGVNGNPDASDLDGMSILPAGVNQPWQTLTFGVQTADTHAFVVRWIVYETLTTGLGAGVMAFSPYVASRDFGIWWNGPPPYWANGTVGAGTWNVSVNISAFGTSVDQTQMYVAQQFRGVDANPPTGDGPFDTSVKSVFNVGGPVNIGSSDDTFYYDEQPDGIYDETEVDYFNEGPGNLLFGVTVNTNSTTNTVQPYQINLNHGRYVSGSLIDTWQADQSYYIASPTQVAAPGVPGYQLDLYGQAAATTATSFHFQLRGSSSAGKARIKVSFFNNTTQKWDVIGTYTLGTSDAVVDVASTNNPAKYVASNRQVLARVESSQGTVFPVGPVAHLMPPQIKIDQAGWVITR